ncbi:TetR/AcrR family transcriptional regulator [Microbacterium sp. TPD7012]|uniref:TetR/AcrR family transcriptional regulator n=1 Tax=Microbacterium sp. TPD7012 TaxID=2171975 RepID=UPI000D51FF50|nr:TetR/AcrR family transcriptional regulator [Microbacterium sp. TPD7012]PVE94100.1 TetR family transcriptional regulator [Microbacterium sp. TPD7012]
MPSARTRPESDVHDETPAPAAKPSSGANTRQRILDAANELFYHHGIRATSADRIIEQVGITKVTFYRHFRAKSDLVVAYLEQQSAAEQTWMKSTVREGDALATARRIAAGIGAASCSPGFRGCAFINAAAEYPDPADPVRVAVDAHRAWLIDFFSGIAGQAGARDVTSVANQLMILRDGAMVNGYLGDAPALAGSLEAGFTAILGSVGGSGR